MDEREKYHNSLIEQGLEADVIEDLLSKWDAEHATGATDASGKVGSNYGAVGVIGTTEATGTTGISGIAGATGAVTSSAKTTKDIGAVGAPVTETTGVTGISSFEAEASLSEANEYKRKAEEKQRRESENKELATKIDKVMNGEVIYDVDTDQVIQLAEDDERIKESEFTPFHAINLDEVSGGASQFIWGTSPLAMIQTTSGLLPTIRKLKKGGELSLEEKRDLREGAEYIEKFRSIPLFGNLVPGRSLFPKEGTKWIWKDIQFLNYLGAGIEKYENIEQWEEPNFDRPDYVTKTRARYDQRADEYYQQKAFEFFETDAGRRLQQAYTEKDAVINVKNDLLTTEEKIIQAEGPIDPETKKPWTKEKMSSKVTDATLIQTTWNANAMGSSFLGEKKFNELKVVHKHQKQALENLTNKRVERAKEIYQKTGIEGEKAWMSALDQAEKEIQPTMFSLILQDLEKNLIESAFDESTVLLQDRVNGGYFKGARQQLSPEQLKRQDLLKEQIEELQLITNDEMLGKLYKHEMTLLALMKEITEQGYPALMSEAGWVQSLSEEWAHMFKGGEGSALRDFSDFQSYLDFGKIMGELTPLPEGDNPLAKAYNNELEQYQTLATAYSINYDPISVERKAAGTFWTAWPDAFGVQYLSDNERADRFSLTDEEGIPVTDIFGYSLNDKERANLHVGSTEKIMGTLPSLIKMGGEIAGVSLLTGGTGTISTILKNVGTLVETGATFLGVGQKTAKVMGTWSYLTAKEALNLEGMNQLGGAIAHTERLPVIPFAIGMTSGSMLFRGGRAGFKRVSDKMMVKQTYAGGLWQTADNLLKHTPSLVKAPIAFGAEIGVQTLTIKGAETVTAIWGYADGSMSELEFAEFWDHAFTKEAFGELFGTMAFMGMRRPGGSKRALEKLRHDIDYLTHGKGVAELNSMARWMNVKKKIKKVTGTTTSEETSWTVEELVDGYNKKIKEIDDATVWDEVTQGTKADAKSQVALVFERLKMKSEIDAAYKSMDNIDRITYGSGSFSNNFQKELDKVALGKDDIFTMDMMTTAAMEGGREFVIKEIQGKTGLPEAQVVEYLKMAEAISEGTSQAGFNHGSPYRKKFMVTEQRDWQITQQLNSLKKQKGENKISDAQYKRSVEVLKLESEKIGEEQSKLIEKQRELNKERLKKGKEKSKAFLGEANYHEVNTPKELDILFEEFTGEKFEHGEGDFGVSGIYKTGPKKGQPFEIINVEAASRVGTVERGLEIVGDEIVVGEKGSPEVQFHERLHPILERYLGTTAMALRAQRLVKEGIDIIEAREIVKRERDEFVQSFIDVLKQTGQYEQTLARVKLHPDYKGGKNPLTKEWFNIFGELEAEGAFAWMGENRSAWEKFKGKLNEWTNKNTPFKNIEFKSGLDAYEFITSLAADKRGEMHPVVKRAVEEYTELIAKGEELGVDLLKEYERSSFEFEDVGPEINSLYSSNRNKWLETKTTNKVFDRIHGNELMGIEGKLLHNLILKRIPINKPSGWDSESTKDFIQSTYIELLPHIRNFNKKFLELREKYKNSLEGTPEEIYNKVAEHDKLGYEYTEKGEKKIAKENDSFFAWVNSYIHHKVAEVFKNDLAGTKKFFEPELGEVIEAGLEPTMEMDIDIDVEVESPKTAADITKEIGLPGSSIEVLDTKISDVSYKDISPIDAPVSKNQTISPFLRDFKKISGETTQKTIMDLMKVEGDYKKYLEDNFSGIVENLPLDYLVKHFPQFIQKSVGGTRYTNAEGQINFKPRWTSNWQGKKTDYVGTEKGMTSGPDYMRLNSAFANEFAKEQFVDNYTSFPGSKNISRDIAAKKKGLAYQLGYQYSIKKFFEQAEIIADLNEGITDLKIKLRENETSYNNKEYSSDRYFGIRQKLEEKIIDLQLKVNDQTIFDAYQKQLFRKDKDKKKIPDSYTRKLNQQILNANYQRSSYVNKNFSTEAKEVFLSHMDKIGDVRSIFPLEKAQTVTVYKRILRSIFYNKETKEWMLLDKNSGRRFSKEDVDAISRELFLEDKYYDKGYVDAKKNIVNAAAVSKINPTTYLRDRLKDLKWDKMRMGLSERGEGKKMDDFLSNLPKDFTIAGYGVKPANIKIQREKELESVKNEINKTGDVYRSIFNALKWGWKHTVTAGGKPGYRDQFFGKGADFLTELKKLGENNKRVNSKGEIVPDPFEVYWETDAQGDLVAGSVRASYKGKEILSEDLKSPSQAVNRKWNKTDNQWRELVNSKDPKKIKEFNKLRDEYELRQKEADEALDYLISRYEFASSEYLNGRMSDIDFALFTASMKSNMRTSLRAAAPYRYVTRLLGNETLTGDVKKDYVWEHKLAADELTTFLGITTLNKSNTKSVKRDVLIGGEIVETSYTELTKRGRNKINEFLKDYEVAQLYDPMDKFLTSAGLQTRRLPGKEAYYNEKTLGHPDMRAMIDLKILFETRDIEAATIGREWAQAAEIAINKPAAEVNSREIAESAVFNRSSYKDKSNKEILDDANNMDKALEKARDPETPVKKIRVFDFDQTLATTNSKVTYTAPPEAAELVGQSTSNYKVIFMAGGPGSGKSNVRKQISKENPEFEVIHSDQAFKRLKKEQGLPTAEAGMTKEQRSLTGKAMAQAVKTAKGEKEQALGTHKGIIIDGTGASSKALLQNKELAENLGYDAQMVMVETSLETAIQRNRARVERSLLDRVVEKVWEQVKGNDKIYEKEFGDNYVKINSETYKMTEPLPIEAMDMINQFTKGYAKGKLSSIQFAEFSEQIKALGGKYDFSEFTKVVEGGKGPLFEVAKIIKEKRGNEDLFVLTARPQESDIAIQEFLKGIGLDLKLENITGLGNGSPDAKAQWLIKKAGEGYNDFYFADDHTANVEAVKRALEPLDVKSRVQQAVYNRSSYDLSKSFNNIIEKKTGIEAWKEYSDTRAKAVGKKAGKFSLIPPSAEDFMGLLYKTLGKGKVGDGQLEFYRENLVKPFARAMENISRDRKGLIADFRALKSGLDVIPKNLRKEAFEGFSYENVVRTYVWNKQGMEIPGISKRDLKRALNFIKKNPELELFANELININKGDGYVKPGTDWLAGTITTDLINGLQTTKRAKYLEQWQYNVDAMFSKANLNKLEAAFGSKYREAMENMLYRMRTGKNRKQSPSRLENVALDYINNSVGAVMFVNMRSAVLQTISAVNYLNWGDNNPLMAGKALANQPRYWKDFMSLMNSDFLVERRNGLRINVSESEIADAASTATNKAKAALSYLLKKGFLPTQIADSFAIASGGAMFYRNRINTYVKEGVSRKEAERKAFEDFREITEENQQSARPDKISQQQATNVGRIILAFANTPSQYARIMKKSALDLAAGRGDAKSHVSKLVYYGAIQNIIFNALQQGLYALAFNEEGNEVKEEKYVGVLNGMLDSLLRGTGIAGAVVSTIKNIGLKLHDESKKEGKFPGPDYGEAGEMLYDVAPPLDSKYSRFTSALEIWEWEKHEIETKGWGLDNPAWLSGALVVSATTNVPVDRLFKKYENVKAALQQDQEWWKRIALLAGWPEWQLESSAEKSAQYEERKKEKKLIRAKEKPSIYTKEEQENVLKQWKYSDEEIDAMKNEDTRVNAILKKQQENNSIKTPKIIPTERKEKKKEIYSLSKNEQIRILKSLGVSDDEIKGLGIETNRVNKILTMRDKASKKVDEAIKKQESYEPTKEEKETKKIFDLNKGEQVDILKGYNLSDADIRALKYEQDRVDKILELQED